MAEVYRLASGAPMQSQASSNFMSIIGGRWNDESKQASK